MEFLWNEKIIAVGIWKNQSSTTSMLALFEDHNSLNAILDKVCTVQHLVDDVFILTMRGLTHKHIFI